MARLPRSPIQMTNAKHTEIVFPDRAGGIQCHDGRSIRSLHFCAEMSGPLLHILAADGHDTVTDMGHRQ
jgi:hypothetical protein